MNLDGITAKIADNAELIGKLYGYLGPMVIREASWGGDPISGIINQHEQAFNALMQGKFPKLQNIIAGLREPTISRQVLQNGLIAYLVGEVGGGFIGSRNANALKKFGEEAIKYSVLSSAVITWEWNPHQGNGFLGSGSSSAPLKVS